MTHYLQPHKPGQAVTPSYKMANGTLCNCKISGQNNKPNSIIRPHVKNLLRTSRIIVTEMSWRYNINPSKVSVWHVWRQSFCPIQDEGWPVQPRQNHIYVPLLPLSSWFHLPHCAPLLPSFFPLGGFGGVSELAASSVSLGPGSAGSWPGSCSPLIQGSVPSRCLGLLHRDGLKVDTQVDATWSECYMQQWDEYILFTVQMHGP